jgi:hypothetical protein
MTAPDDLREKVARAIRKNRMVAYDDGTGGHLFREATDLELADAALAVVDTGLAEKVAALADRWESWGSELQPPLRPSLAAADLRALVREHEQAADQ